MQNPIYCSEASQPLGLKRNIDQVNRRLTSANRNSGLVNRKRTSQLDLSDTLRSRFDATFGNQMLVNVPNL